MMIFPLFLGISLSDEGPDFLAFGIKALSP
jgi:hypothetical protein